MIFMMWLVLVQNICIFPSRKGLGKLPDQKTIQASSLIKFLTAHERVYWRQCNWLVGSALILRLNIQVLEEVPGLGDRAAAQPAPPLHCAPNPARRLSQVGWSNGRPGLSSGTRAAQSAVERP